MLKYFGLLLIASAGVFTSREYEKTAKKRLFELREFIRLIEHIKLKISCFLAPKTDWLSDFKAESEAIAELLILAKTMSLDESFASVKSRLSLMEEGEALERLFSSLGKAYKDSEISVLEASLSELSLFEKRLSEELPKNVKTVKVLTTAISLGLIILLI